MLHCKAGQRKERKFLCRKCNINPVNNVSCNLECSIYAGFFAWFIKSFLIFCHICEGFLGVVLKSYFSSRSILWSERVRKFLSLLLSLNKLCFTKHMYSITQAKKVLFLANLESKKLVSLNRKTH